MFFNMASYGKNRLVGDILEVFSVAAGGVVAVGEVIGVIELGGGRQALTLQWLAGEVIND